MIFCTKIKLCMLMVLILFTTVGCGHNEDKKSFFNRQSAYDQFVNDHADSTKPKRIGNVIYLGSNYESSPQNRKKGEMSFEFEDLKR